MSKARYFAITEPLENTIVISKSRFITTLMPIDDFDDAMAKVKAVSKKYGDATHNCYAFISNESATEQRFSDDGEPQGTAGVPMLEVLKKRGVYKTLAIVTRYFGGIKLGANGLVGAYSSSVSEALNRAKTVEMIWAVAVKITLSYGVYKKVEDACVILGGQTIGVEYGNDVTLTVAIPEEIYKDVVAKIVDITLDKAKIELLDSNYFAFECK
ncbi:MAG: YigZ family protein [Clostridia bacterium]|nr:YigZ family protein [Clostridia bacterium]